MKRTPIPKRRKPRRGPMRDAKYRRWLKWVSCCLWPVHWIKHGVARICDGTTDAAHTQNNGMGSKGPDSSCAPLCRKHHKEYDAGRRAFEKKYGVDMKKIAAEHYARFLEETHS